MADKEDTQTYANDSATSNSIDTRLARLRSRIVRTVTREKRAKNPEGVVYFLQNSLGIKIGFTTDLESRIRRLQTGCPEDLEQLGTIPGTYATEAEIKARFAHLNIQREWFEPRAELLAYIREVTGQPVIPPEATAMISGLLVKRKRVGARTPEGYRLSNLIEQIPWLYDTSGDRSWAKHPSQQVAWMMKAQLAS